MPRSKNVVPFPKFKAAQAKAKKPEPIPHQWTCKRCEHDIGVATSMITTMTICPLIKGVRVTGGTKIKVCAYCWQRGIKTEVF